MRVIVFIVLAGLSSQATAQEGARQAPFTADDALAVVSYQVADLSADGRWLASLSSTRRDGLGVDYRRDGDPTYIRPGASRVWSIDTQTGEARPIFPDARNVRSPVWSPNGDRLALLALRGERFEPVIWERATGKTRSLPIADGWYVAENSDVRWTHDGQRLIVALRTDAWRRRVTAEFQRMTQGPVFVQDSHDPFLAWDAIRREGNVRAVYALDVASGRATPIVPESMIASYALTEDDSLVTWQDDITKKTDYDVIFGSENRLMVQRLSGGAAFVVQPTLKGMTVVWARDGRRYAYAKDGRVWVASLGDTAGGSGRTARRIAGADTGTRSADADTSAAARERRAAERFSVVRWSPSGDALLLSNRQGLWLANPETGTRDLMVATDDSSLTAPRYAAAAWSEDGRYVYLSYASRTQWERGIVRYDRTTRTLQELVKDGRLYQGLRLSKSGAVTVYAAADGNHPSDIYTADAGLTGARRLTTANPQFATKSLARTRLISYHDVDGKTRHGVVYLPADYVDGRKYPTLFNIYEDFFDDTFDATVNVLTSSGYVVVKPSVGFDIGYPGEAWLKAVTAAANHLVEAGIADSAKLGVFGTSYGGYATNLLITQTNRFAAAVNISGKVDLISFYTDSPRLGVRNTHAAEKSQDRIGATLWQQPQKYVAHSAIMFADRITTPLMLVTGAQDSNVPADNTREMYYALRRLGKEVVWVDYMNSGHGTPATNATEFLDFHQRLLGFFDRHLKDVGDRVSEEQLGR